MFVRSGALPRLAGPPGNGVSGPLPPVDGGKGPFTPRAKASDGGKGPFTSGRVWYVVGAGSCEACAAVTGLRPPLSSSPEIRTGPKTGVSVQILAAAGRTVSAVTPVPWEQAGAGGWINGCRNTPYRGYFGPRRCGLENVADGEAFCGSELPRSGGRRGRATVPGRHETRSVRSGQAEEAVASGLRAHNGR